MTKRKSVDVPFSIYRNCLHITPITPFNKDNLVLFQINMFWIVWKISHFMTTSVNVNMILLTMWSNSNIHALHLSLFSNLAFNWGILWPCLMYNHFWHYKTALMLNVYTYTVDPACMNFCPKSRKNSPLIIHFVHKALSLMKWPPRQFKNNKVNI